MADNGADVADDYRQALEDLTVNSRIEIATLTNIARENASHGFAISDALANHIKSAPPHRTLPALYVLDSVVKNVPTPYALYFGPKLYSIFMGAYTKVDNGTRRKMDEMLKTWKEPVPGSISTKPVFPPELVRPIENALMGARNVFAARQNTNFQAQQQLMRGRQPAPSRETPTPPTGRPYQPPPAQQQNQQQPAYPGSNGHRPDTAPAQPQQSYPATTPANGPNAIPLRATPQPAPSAGPYPPYQQHQPPSGPVYGAPQPGISIDKLKDDVQRLIIAEKAEFAQDPLDTSKQTRLKALLDLQTIIQSQAMPQDQLMIINDRVAELAVNIRPQQQQQQQQQQQSQSHLHHRQQPPVSAGPADPGVAAPYLGASPYTTPTPPQQPTPVPSSAAAVVAAALARPQSATAARPPAAGGVSIDALLGQGALAALISRKSATPQQQTQTPPPPPLAAPPPQVPAGIPPSAAAVIAAALRSPRLNETPRPVVAPPHPPVAAAGAPAPAGGDPSALLAMLRQSGLIKPGLTPTPPPAGTGFPGGFHSLGGAVAPGGGQLSVASLKSFRPHLIPRLYDDLGPPCSQCGRRFQTTDEGRRKKTAHMDWHFRVHQRMADAERRGQHRSWYVDELDWIRTREAIDTDYTDPSASSHPTSGPASTTGASSGAAAAAANRTPYIPVPEDSSRVSSACPICQEKFEMKWLDEAQEWVWTDAVRVGGRVFHASCYGEAYGGVPGQGNGGGGVLGKRKAEDDVGGARGRVKMEGW